MNFRNQTYPRSSVCSLRSLFLLFGFLTKEHCCLLFLLPLERLLCGAQGREKVEGILVPQMLQSQKPDPKGKQVINLDQDVHVCEYFGG